MSTLIVGAGQAGLALAARLRAGGETGPITLVGEEGDPPYQRPPLSKAYLTGATTRERLWLRPREWYAGNGIDLRLGTRVTAVSPAERTVTAGGEHLGWDRLALCTGAIPRRLPANRGGDLEGVFTLRTLADADAMRPFVREGGHAVVVGGGYIGLEAAAVCRQAGMKVTVLEAAARILGRVAAPETADWFRALHRANGVTVREGTALDRLEGEGAVSGAVLADGTEIPATLVVCGIGIVPDAALAATAGLMTEDGIDVDARGRTALEGVWAAGDCARLPWRGRRVRLESVQNAIDQAEAVAGDMLGIGADYDPVPWFWSDQYDAKLQIAGLSAGHDAVHVRQAGGARSHWYYRDGVLIAVDAMNAPRDYMIGKRLLEAGRSPGPEALGAEDLKPLLGA
ncbi:3-phenylpropionate/trans-cinnamate dioxygenase ferredoxin reductase subunit [Hasllibacter halocynthiae]|uniref:3-phenylpropionate/trans-cinnamate dioxygenase ferredoxin reductase subunit n=1 Tax=Hasllibacter halocynthiae TaxID=595589 RepID=A0A2T0X1W7_9RHOB|nr:FAD-dependent oxidoreductase [Hasllibacter halocynthiae]PRY92938.1 3-phenylpropionate/trans-cinnamate dioxygenase ferredoxin reductase subunit [Hasllibacter halocynthiae]